MYKLLNPWTPGGTFIDQKMAITSITPSLRIYGRAVPIPLSPPIPIPIPYFWPIPIPIPYFWPIPIPILTDTDTCKLSLNK